MSEVETSLILTDRSGYGGGHESYGGGYGHGGSYGLDPVSFLALLTFLTALTYLLYWCITNQDQCLPNLAAAPAPAPAPAPTPPPMAPTPAPLAPTPAPLAPSPAPLDPGFEAPYSTWEDEAFTLHPLSYLETLPVASWSNFSSLDALFPPIPDYL